MNTGNFQNTNLTVNQTHPVEPQTIETGSAAVETAAEQLSQSSWMQTRFIVRMLLIIIGMILAIAGGLILIYKLEGVLLLVVLATFFAYLIAPLVDFVRKPFKNSAGEHKMPRPIAIGIVYLVIFGSLGLTTYFLAPQLAKQVTDFTTRSSTYRGMLEGRSQTFRSLAQRMGLPVALQEAVVNFAPNAMESAKTIAADAAPQVILLLPWLILIPVLGFFLLKDAEAFRRSALQMLPRGRMRWRGDEFFQDINSTLAAYIRAQLTACLIIGVICSLGFLLIGVPYWLALGIIAGLFEFVPLAGPLTVGVIATVVASFNSGSDALLTLTFLVVLRIVHDYVIYPRIMGQGIHLHPLAVVLAILGGEELAGLAGIFLAIPVVAIISVTYRHWLEHRGSAGIVADLLKPVEQAATPSPAQVATGAADVTPQPVTAQTPSSVTR